MQLLQRDNKQYIYLAIILSFVVHILMMPSKFTSFSISEVTPKKEKRIKLKLRDSSKARQIVQSALTSKDLAQDSKFLSETNNSVDRETKAKVVDSFNLGGLGNAKIDQKSIGKKAKDKSKNKKEKKSKTGKISFQDFSFAEKSPMQQDQNLIKGTKTGSKNSRGIASSNDHVEDIALGDITKFNTTEYKYYGFYFRIKQQLEQHWGKSLREKMESLYRQNRRGPAGEKFLTSVKVILDKKGQIVDVIVQGSSGIKELDDAAVESFNKAGPFPNPPAGILSNGYAKIEWGFAVTKN